MTDKEKIPSIGQELYSFLVRRFPVCCWSDEFTFFPQALEGSAEWSRWDDFSPESVEETAAGLREFHRRIDHVLTGDPGLSESTRQLGSLIGWVTRTLEEQFTLVRTHATQPTFVLTVASLGLIQALESGAEDALEQRLSNLPGFLDGAYRSFAQVPELYKELGLKMSRGLAHWVISLGPITLTGASLEAIEVFSRRLAERKGEGDFRLAPDLLERIVCDHTGSGLTLGEALLELEEEASDTERLLVREARKLGHGGGRESFFSSLPGDPMPSGGRKELLGREIRRLRDHCLREGFFGYENPGGETLRIEPLPPSLATIRAADSYNARPGNPFQGGVFYLFEGGHLGRDSTAPHPVFRMTAAHEAYPGHHLLDHFRWNNPEPALRPIEYPLFYEGWACFGEDLMFHTGAFDRPYDRLILLRRRFRHAVRGKVDLMLHSGDLEMGPASEMLVSAGFSRPRALETVKKYALRPAYQMCYTIGRERFRRLFELYGKGSVGRFANTVLCQGELLFEDLERVLKGSGGGERGRGRGGETTV